MEDFVAFSVMSIAVAENSSKELSFGVSGMGRWLLLLLLLFFNCLLKLYPAFPGPFHILAQGVFQ